jgi:xanthine dehydrogenase YagR molybdenum-binding subunit
MATATYPVYLSPAAAKVRLSADGSVVAQSGTHELGTGTYTAMTMIVADALGLPVEKVRFELGGTTFRTDKG